MTATGRPPGQTGQSLVETALALPVLVLFAAAAVELARLTFYAAVVQVAATQAARCRSVTDPAADKQEEPTDCVPRAVEAAREILQTVGAERAHVKVRIRPVERMQGSPSRASRVEVTYEARTYFFVIAWLVGRKAFDGTTRIPIMACALSRVENPDSAGRSAGG